MSGLALLALALACAWLCALTLTLLACVRQLGAITVRLQLNETTPGKATPRAIGFQIPEAAATMEAALSTGRKLVLLLSTSCGSCAKLAEALAADPLDEADPEIVLLLDGDPAKDEEAARIVAEIGPIAKVVSGGTANALASVLGLSSVPSAMLLDGGVVAGNLLFADTVDQLRRLSATHHDGNVGPIVEPRLVTS
jgi:hypothetical protein